MTRKSRAYGHNYNYSHKELSAFQVLSVYFKRSYRETKQFFNKITKKIIDIIYIYPTFVHSKGGKNEKWKRQTICETDQRC